MARSEISKGEPPAAEEPQQLPVVPAGRYPDRPYSEAVTAEYQAFLDATARRHAELRRAAREE